MKWISTLIVLMGFFSSKAQQVESSAYGLMLKGLLSHSVKEINVSEASEMHRQNAVFVDAREPKESKVSTIPGAICVGYNQLNLSAIDSLDKNTPIVVYCSVGYRSEKVAEQLISEGFKNVSNLYGGIFEWVNQDGPLVKQGEPTKKVHGYSRVWGIWLNKGEKIYD